MTSELIAHLDGLFAQHVAPLQAQITELRTFMDRRVAEISNEVTLSVQMMEINEVSITKALAGVRDELATVVHASATATAANSGYELETVVHEAEKAALRILDAAERIRGRLDAEMQDPNHADMVRPLRDAIGRDIADIFEASEFQDLTGQRIRKAMLHLTRVEDTLNSTLEKLGVTEPAAPVVQEKALGQGDVDALFP